PLTPVQSDDYYPFGLEIPGANMPSLKNEYLYNKKELQEEIKQYDYGARFYDPVIARWNAPDMLAELSYNLTPYRYCYNNPINFTDPYGLWETDANGNQHTDKKEDIARFTLYLQAEAAMKVTPNIDQISTFVGQEKAGGLGKLTDGTKLLNPVNVLRYNKVGGEVGYKVDQKSFSNFWHQVQGDLTPDALDPRTLHQNILGLTYAGPWNPKTYGGKDDYSHLPDDPEDVPAYIHDKDFDKLKAVGAGPVFNDPRTQGPNVKLVNSELGVATSLYASPISRVRAIIVAEGIGAATMYNSFSNTVKDFINFHPGH
ncbi:MAG TPA: RHS repeat-associated core domain-containing protein, partial [Mucilaginibacter sp.]|nr:RHS repeat-associated core domain-containing protein [Mucilaginibacter sp.]